MCTMDSTQMAHNPLFHHPPFIADPSGTAVQHLQHLQLQFQLQNQHQNQNLPHNSHNFGSPYSSHHQQQQQSTSSSHALSMATPHLSQVTPQNQIQQPQMSQQMSQHIPQHQHHIPHHIQQNHLLASVQQLSPIQPDIFHQHQAPDAHLLNQLEQSHPDIIPLHHNHHHHHHHDHTRDLSNTSSIITTVTSSSQTSLDTIQTDDCQDSQDGHDLDEPEAITVTYLDASKPFPSLGAAKAFVLERARVDGFGISCRRSRKNRQGKIISAQMMCDRSRSATSTSTGQRKTRTRRTNCPWAVTILLESNTGIWRLRETPAKGNDGDEGSSPIIFSSSNPFPNPNLLSDYPPSDSLSFSTGGGPSTSTTLRLFHNHPASKTPGSHPCHRKMTAEMETFIEALQSVQTRPSKIFQVLQDRFPDVPVNQQDVYNALARLKKRGSNKLTTAPSTPETGAIQSMSMLPLQPAMDSFENLDLKPGGILSPPGL